MRLLTTQVIHSPDGGYYAEVFDYMTRELVHTTPIELERYQAVMRADLWISNNPRQHHERRETMKFSTMIPVKRNDGTPVYPSEFDGLVQLFWEAFGGCTVDSISTGYWKDETGKLFVDKVRRLTVVVDCNSQANLDYARLLVRKVGVQLGQKVMYFEHDSQGANAVEFIDIDPNEDFTALSEQEKQHPYGVPCTYIGKPPAPRPAESDSADVSQGARDRAYLAAPWPYEDKS